MDSIGGALGIYAATFAIAFISGLFPLVNAELALIGAVAAMPADVPHAIALGTIVGCGQIAAQSLLFKTAHRVADYGGKKRVKLEIRIARARARVAKWGNKRVALLCTSATIGLPPFLLVTIAGGVLEIPFRLFVGIGLPGRVIRFATIAAIAASV